MSKNNNLLISIVIPCLNAEDCIEECIESAYNQEYKNIEVIIVDNNSTDNTQGVINSIRESKYRDLIVFEEKKPGANAARNKGVKEAKGEWVQFLDSDDLILTDKLTHQINIIQDNPKIDIICSSYINLSIENQREINAVYSLNQLSALFNKKAGITSANLFRKKAIEDVGYWDLTLMSSQEFDLMMKFYINNKQFYFDDNPKTIIRERMGQISKSNPKIRWNTYITIRIYYFHLLKEKQTAIFEKNYTTLLMNILNSVLHLSNVDPTEASKISKKIMINKKLLKKELGVSKRILFGMRYLSFSFLFKLMYFHNKYIKK